MECRVARTAQSTSLLKPTACGSGCLLFATPIDEFPQQLRPVIRLRLNMTAPRCVPPSDGNTISNRINP